MVAAALCNLAWFDRRVAVLHFTKIPTSRGWYGGSGWFLGMMGGLGRVQQQRRRVILKGEWPFPISQNANIATCHCQWLHHGLGLADVHERCYLAASDGFACIKPVWCRWLGLPVFCEMWSSEIEICEMDCERNMWNNVYFAKILWNTDMQESNQRMALSI